jgi:hypothetical protein
MDFMPKKRYICYMHISIEKFLTFQMAISLGVDVIMLDGTKFFRDYVQGEDGQIYVQICFTIPDDDHKGKHIADYAYHDFLDLIDETLSIGDLIKLRSIIERESKKPKKEDILHMTN